MTAPVVPTQQDRDAAAALAEWLTNAQKEWEGMPVWFAADAPRAFRDGALDNHDYVQAFARHRLAALEEAARVADSLAELVSTVIAAKGITDPRVAALMAYEQAAAAIRSLKEQSVV